MTNHCYLHFWCESNLRHSFWISPKRSHHTAYSSFPHEDEDQICPYDPPAKLVCLIKATYQNWYQVFARRIVFVLPKCLHCNSLGQHRLYVGYSDCLGFSFCWESFLICLSTIYWQNNLPVVVPRNLSKATSITVFFSKFETQLDINCFNQLSYLVSKLAAHSLVQASQL